MGVFESAQSFPFTVSDLTPVAQDVMRHFQRQGYEVNGEQTITRGWDISIHKGAIFKAILGMKTALKVTIEPSSEGTSAKARIGIFGQQAIPTVISMLLFWPVLIPQIWGIVQQSKLDEEALRSIETSLKAHSGTAGTAPGSRATGTAGRFCTSCGTQLPAAARFCPECGAKAA